MSAELHTMRGIIAGLLVALIFSAATCDTPTVVCLDGFDGGAACFCKLDGAPCPNLGECMQSCPI